MRCISRIRARTPEVTSASSSSSSKKEGSPAAVLARIAAMPSSRLSSTSRRDSGATRRPSNGHVRGGPAARSPGTSPGPSRSREPSARHPRLGVPLAPGPGRCPPGRDDGAPGRRGPGHCVWPLVLAVVLLACLLARLARWAAGPSGPISVASCHTCSFQRAPAGAAVARTMSSSRPRTTLVVVPDSPPHGRTDVRIPPRDLPAPAPNGLIMTRKQSPSLCHGRLGHAWLRQHVIRLGYFRGRPREVVTDACRLPGGPRATTDPCALRRTGQPRVSVRGRRRRA